MSSQLTPQNRERTIDALARNNNIIKSLFPYQKHISFLVVSLAIQKIKIKAHKDGLVVISKNEIQSLATGNDAKIGINNLIKAIRKDLEVHNFFNLYESNSGLKDIRQSLIHQTALTKDLFEDLTITFNPDLFTTFQSEKNYTIQSLNQLRNCNENQATAIYALTQPYAKPQSPYLTLNILELRAYLRIADDAYAMPRTLTMRVKKICQMVSTRTDINLSVEPIKKNTKTGATIGYCFYSEYKDKPSKKITATHLIEQKPISIRQQLSNWGVSKKQINTWIANLGKKTIHDAIKQTLNRPYREDKNSNAGGYIYSILGDGKSFKSIKQIKSNKEVIYSLEKFGLSSPDIKKAQKQTKGNMHVLIAVVNKCLREIENQGVDENGVREYFTNQLDEVLSELNKIRKIENV